MDAASELRPSWFAVHAWLAFAFEPVGWAGSSAPTGRGKKNLNGGAVLGEVNGTACGVAGVPGADARVGREAKAVVAVHSAFRNVPRVQIVQISAFEIQKPGATEAMAPSK